MTLTFNITSFTQHQINLIQASLVSILQSRGVTYDSISCLDGVCMIANPSDLNVSISESDILADIAAKDAQRAAVIPDSDEQKLLDIKAAIDAAETVEDALMVLSSYG